MAGTHYWQSWRFAVAIDLVTESHENKDNKKSNSHMTRIQNRAVLTFFIPFQFSCELETGWFSMWYATIMSVLTLTNCGLKRLYWTTTKMWKAQSTILKGFGPFVHATLFSVIGALKKRMEWHFMIINQSLHCLSLPGSCDNQMQQVHAHVPHKRKRFMTYRTERIYDVKNKKSKCSVNSHSKQKNIIFTTFIKFSSPEK